MNSDYINIALADDDEDDRLFFTDAFEELKIKSKVSTFEDGIELMEFLENSNNTHPDLLFLDLNMPKKSGLECLVEIKTNDRFKNMVIAIYSTSSSEMDIENTFVQGANIYIKKPNNFETLKKVLSEVVTTNWQYHTNGLNKENFLLRL
ncbi:response regulator receiver domain-containing protein [Winogradskyella epiphytica]|uniref:Response regulator receiver domain-containing protein n=1 Tax=Winogradskyella epiphytica TaxID=262005 RepID=A0A2V4YAA1_9FLAO|nr:response regulator [Winogradskyella epiphytica]PYE79628.1 response regulator receiver domain-containing protein [Winogradskyella epiphytica]GGW73753.1 response regulator [Winogradskyella epiphytica]